MIEFTDTQPDVAVAAAEYNRLLGYPPGWTLDGRAAELADQAHAWPCAVDALESGALRPTKSRLAAFGLTHDADRLRGLLGSFPCEQCSFELCGYRRVPYKRRCQHPAADSLGSRDDVQT